MSLEQHALPAFNDSVLSSLRRKVQKEFGESSAPKGQKSNPPKRQKHQGSDKSSLIVPVIKTARKSLDNHNTVVPKYPARKDTERHKRLRNGDLKSLKSDAVSRPESLSRAPEKLRSAGASSLEREILELGGDQADIDLLLPLDSGSESAYDGETADDLIDEELSKAVALITKDSGIDLNRIHEESSDNEEGILVEANGNEVPPVQIQDPLLNHTSRLIIPPGSSWPFTDLQVLQFPSDSAKNAADDSTIGSIYAHAKTMLGKECDTYRQLHRSDLGSASFLRTMMTKGTLSDKIGSLTLAFQESPLHNVSSLEQLITLARKRSRTQAIEVLGALKDLFINGDILPSDRKLRAFKTQPCLKCFSQASMDASGGVRLPEKLTDAHILEMAYEDWLKSRYFEFIQILESWSNDEIVFARLKSIDYIYSLLKEKPEQEANLLKLLVNKLGDPEKKVASKASFNILQLQTAHPAMKSTIISAIESDHLFRRGQSLHAQYYAVITLNQTVLSRSDSGLAKQLIKIYFDVFHLLLSSETVEAHIDVPKAPIVKPLVDKRKRRTKITKVAKSLTPVADLREKCMSAVLTGMNRAIPFNPESEHEYDQHLDTLFRITHSSNFNTGVQALILIQQLHGANQKTTDRFYRTLYESILDSRLLTASKQALYLNLLYRALRSDLSIKRVQAFGKRLLQSAAMQQPVFACAILYLLRELEEEFPGLRASVEQPEHDGSLDAEMTIASQNQHVSMPNPLDQSPMMTYNGRKRDPLYANASNTALWELNMFLTHYHPSVTLFAERFVHHGAMPPKPDLSLNTLAHFLDRFVYRNPKAASKQVVSKGLSIMQPLSGGERDDMLVSKNTAHARQQLPVNSSEFWQREPVDIDPHEIFFHKYFSRVENSKQKASGKTGKKGQLRQTSTQDSEDDSISEGESSLPNDQDSDTDQDEAEIWKALVQSNPEVDGSDDPEMDDSGDEFSDLNDLDSSTEEFDLDGSINADEEHDDEPLFDSDNSGPVVSKDISAHDALNASADEIGSAKENRKRHRKHMKSLPVFASAEDYAQMLDGDEEEGMSK